jgi:hypothetical protein
LNGLRSGGAALIVALSGGVFLPKRTFTGDGWGMLEFEFGLR